MLSQAHSESESSLHLWSSLTIQQLVDEHKVVLDILLTDLPKVGRHDITHLVEELEHHSSVDILLGDSSQPDVGALDMKEASAGDVGDRGAHLLSGVDHIHAERVHGIASDEKDNTKFSWDNGGRVSTWPPSASKAFKTNIPLVCRQSIKDSIGCFLLTKTLKNLKSCSKLQGPVDRLILLWRRFTFSFLCEFI